MVALPPLTNQVAVYIISSQTCVISAVSEREPGHVFLLQAQFEHNQSGSNITMLLKIQDLFIKTFKITEDRITLWLLFVTSKYSCQQSLQVIVMSNTGNDNN